MHNEAKRSRDVFETLSPLALRFIVFSRFLLWQEHPGCYSPLSLLAMAAAAWRPSPMARITVAPPRTMSPPA